MDCSQTAIDNAPPNLVMPALPGHAPSRRVPCRARSAVLRLLFGVCSDIPRRVVHHVSSERSSSLRQSHASAIDIGTHETDTDLWTEYDLQDHGCILDPDCVLRDHDSDLHSLVMNLLPVCAP